MTIILLMLGVLLLCSTTNSNLTKEQRANRAKEIGRQTAYKKLGINVEKKDEHTWVVRKANCKNE